MTPVSDISGILGWFLLLFTVAWIGTCAMISLTGGWHRLAQKFRSTSVPHGETFRFASMSLGTGFFPARYRRVLSVTVGASGIGLSVSFIFRLLHPPLYIPWTEVENVRPERAWLSSHIAVYLRGFDKRLLFRGPAGRKILETFTALTPS
ncbi:MAG: hypothetical protein OEM48_10700 [Gammaproteobacteria bacterium]|nr:hypothetical protein [Gammaproteobacteria bacterium]MDH3407374.1 hypothetical protein [Gammaproteobacteria bacterium]MDH5487522.1 hypothetical protein [Gammaproteobacteria bacterium]